MEQGPPASFNVQAAHRRIVSRRGRLRGEPRPSRPLGAGGPRDRAGDVDELSARIEVVTADADLAALTLASCSSNVEAILSMLTTGIPASAAQAPVTALEHRGRWPPGRGGQRHAALLPTRARPLPRPLGRGARGHRRRPGLRVLAALREATDFAVESRRPGLRQRQRRAPRSGDERRSALLRADLVRALLAGETHDPHAAQRTLGHRLNGPQLCAVCLGTAAYRSPRVG